MDNLGMVLKKTKFKNNEGTKTFRTLTVMGQKDPIFVNSIDYNTFNVGDMVLLNRRTYKNKEDKEVSSLSIIKIKLEL